MEKKIKKLLKNRNALLLAGGIIVVGLILVIGLRHCERYRMAHWLCEQTNKTYSYDWGYLGCDCYAECVEELSGGSKFRQIDDEICIETCYRFNKKYL